VALPTPAQIVPGLPRVGLVYQRTDRFEEFPDVEPEYILALDRALKQEADVTVFLTRVILDGERDQCRRPVLVSPGVDFDRFAAGSSGPDPDDMRSIPRPRVGYIGAIDPHSFDPELLRAVVARLPEVQFVLVGGSTLPDGWITAPNVHLLGQKPYDEVWRYP